MRAVETVILQDLTSQGVQKARVSWRTRGFRGDEALYRGMLPLYIELQLLVSQSENACVCGFGYKPTPEIQTIHLKTSAKESEKSANIPFPYRHPVVNREKLNKI